MKLLLVVAAAAALAVASGTRMSLEDLEFHAWKLKFCEFVVTPNDRKRADKTLALTYFLSMSSTSPTSLHSEGLQLSPGGGSP